MAELTNDELREFLVTRVRPLILEHYKRNSCIATVKVALEVLRYAGVPAKAWPCSLLVTNQMAAPVYLRDMTDEEMAEVVAAGGHAVEIAGHGGRDGTGWDGHLVILAEFSDVPHLLDLSLDQAKRSTWRIDVGPVAVPLWATTETTRPIYSWVGTSMVRWAPIQNNSWRAVPDWKHNDLTGPLAGTLIRELRIERAAVDGG